MTAQDDMKPYAYALAGLSMMLNIRLCYSSAPYALIRFRLPENLFSVFVRRMASSLELWCLPSMCLGNIMDFAMKRAGLDSGPTKKYLITYQSIFWSWCNFLTFVILLFVYIPGDQGHLTTFYWVIAASGFVFGIYMVLVYAVDGMQLAWYMIGENSFPMLTSLIHYFATLMFGNRRKWNSDYLIVYIDIVVAILISLVAAIVWACAYGPDEQGGGWGDDPFNKKCINKLQLKPDGTGTSNDYTINAGSVTEHSTNCGYKYFPPGRWQVLSPSLMVLVGMGLVYMIYPGIAPGMIVPFYLIDRIEMILLIATAFPPVIIGIMKSKGIYDPYVFMGNWGGKHAEDKADGYLTLTSESGSYSGTTITLKISKAGYKKTGSTTNETSLNLSTSGGTNTLQLTSGTAISGGGQTYTLTRKAGNSLTLTLTKTDPNFTDGIYNVILNIESNISLGSITLKQTTDPVNLGTYNISGGGTDITGTPEEHSSHQSTNCCIFGKQNSWSDSNNRYGWHSFIILAPIKIFLAIIFVYSLHHPDSAIARSIINQPKMSTFLSIIFYMCHECLLAVGFPGLAPDPDFLLPMQLIGAFIMVLPAMYSEGYLIEYKSHDPAHWPTEGMTKWNAFCYWCKRASKITNHNLRSLFTTDLRRDLLLCIQKNELI